jgi:hypothetical protein
MLIQAVNPPEPIWIERVFISSHNVGLRSMDTERFSPRYSGIDLWNAADILDALIEGQFAAVAAVRRRPKILII